MPFRKARDLLREILPYGRRGMSHVSIRRHTMRIGEELHRRATDRAEYDECGPGRAPVEPANVLAVALDGTWVRGDPNSRSNQFHVLAGRIERNGRLTNHFAWVPEAIRAGSTAFMKSALDDADLVENYRVSTLVHGADGLHSIVREATGAEPQRQLDWFHISMRLRHIEQMTAGKKSLLGMLPESENWPQRIPQLRWRLWHGRWKEVLVDLSDLGRASRVVTRTATKESR